MCVSPPSPPTPRPPPVVEPLPVRRAADSVIPEDATGENAQARRRARVQARGRRGTMLTGAEGVTETPSLGIRTLLG
jgi:hypothetical protein